MSRATPACSFGAPRMTAAAAKGFGMFARLGMDLVPQAGRQGPVLQILLLNTPPTCRKN